MKKYKILLAMAILAALMGARYADLTYANTIQEESIPSETAEPEMVPETEEKTGAVLAVAKTEDYITVYAAADRNSSEVGKLYDNNLAKVVNDEEDFYLINSGSVFGYVEKEALLLDEEAAETALGEASYGETLTEEKAREREENGGAAVVDFACRYVGNPYVWGGSSLTNGADCSGFVMAVYADFGVSLPHSSQQMRSCGYEVSYEEAQPGDIICYQGHVAIYAGDGQIVHAFNSKDGIVVSEAQYKSIVCVRRIF